MSSLFRRLTVYFSFAAALMLCTLLVRAQESPKDDSSPQLAETVNQMLWVTEQYPPYHYLEDNQIKGIAVDILEQIFLDYKVPFNRDKQVLVFPWARAVKEISNNHQAALLTMAYTPERDNLFKLSEPLFTEQIALISLKSSSLEITHLDQISQYVIGVVRDDIGERLLKDKGPGEIHLTHVLSSKELLQMLIKQRVDAIAYSLDIIRYQLRDLPGNNHQIKIQLNLAELPTSIAFNKQVDANLLQAINRSIVDLKQNGTVERIINNSVQ